MDETAPTVERRSARSRLRIAVGVVLLLVAAVGVAYPLWWNHRSQVGGRKLLAETPPTLAAPTGTSPQGSSCAPALPSTTSTSSNLVGLLEIPALGVKAPVLQGLTDPVLNIAVGHDPGSPWPGAPGEALLEAHDVSYFAEIDKLHRGDQVYWVDGCGKTTFRVVGYQVTTPGVLLNPPPNGAGLALVTCSPTDALWWTPDRYIVQADFVSWTRLENPPDISLPPAPDLHVPAPPSLVAQGLTLQTNYPLLGTLDLTGSPAPTFEQSPQPLQVEALALEDYFGTQKAVAAGNNAWWQAISVPGLAMPAPWSTSAPLYITIDVQGTTVVSVTISSSYVNMRLVASGNNLLVGKVTQP